MIDLLVLAPSDEFSHHVPSGFIFADEVFAEAGLNDPISTAQKGAAQLRRSLYYLANRYPKRLRITWIDPWSPRGLFFMWRYRLRDFPTVVLLGPGQKQVLSGPELERLQEHVTLALARSGLEG